MSKHLKYYREREREVDYTKWPINYLVSVCLCVLRMLSLSSAITSDGAMAEQVDDSEGLGVITKFSNIRVVAGSSSLPLTTKVVF